MKQIDAAVFRSDVFACIAEQDQMWTDERDERYGKIVPVPQRYPVMARVLQSIELFPTRDSSDRIEFYWIMFPARGGFYSPETMISALKQRLSEKRDQYRDSEKVKAFTERVLVIHYDQARAYNSPVETPFFKFRDAAIEGSKFLDHDPGLFTRVFLLIALEPSGRVFQLYP